MVIETMNELLVVLFYYDIGGFIYIKTTGLFLYRYCGIIPKQNKREISWGFERFLTVCTVREKEFHKENGRMLVFRKKKEEKREVRMIFMGFMSL